MHSLELPACKAEVGMPLWQALSGYFGDLNTQEYADIAAHCEWIEYDGGEVIYQQGDVGDGLYIVVSGRLRAILVKPDNSRQLLGDIVAGETVGEMAILSDDRRSATVFAARDSVVIRIPAAP